MKKGRFHSPKNGANGHRKDRRRSSTTTTRNTPSAADAARREWLLEIAAKCNLPVPDAALSSTGGTWQLTSRGRAIGRLKAEAVESGKADLVEKLCEQVFVVKADVGRALDAPWQEISGNLHAARERIDAIVNACTRALILHELSGGAAPNLYEIATKTDAQMRAAAAIKLEELNRKKPPKDEDAETRSKRESTAARLATTAAFSFSGATRSMLTQRAQSSFIKWTKHKRDERFPHATRGQPIPLRAADGWGLALEKGSFVLEFKIGEGETCRYRVKVHPSGGSAIAAARELAEGKASRRDAKLFWDEARKRWIVAMTMGRRRQPPPDLGANPLTMVVRIGMRKLLGAWFSDSSYAEIVAGGRTGSTLLALLRRKQQLLDAKRVRQRGISEMARGPNAVRKKNRRKLGALGRAERAFVDTTCKQIAANVANVAAHSGATRIIVQVPTKPFSDEDAKYLDPWLLACIRRFPLGELSSRIVWALDKRGLPSEVNDIGYDACTCPDCGKIDGGSHDPAKHYFDCTNEACELEGNADYIAAINAMARSGVPTEDLKRMLQAAHLIARELRKKRAA